MLFVWWAALRLSVHLLTVKERRCDTSERSVITPAIIMETILQNKAEYLFFFVFLKTGKKKWQTANLTLHPFKRQSNRGRADTSK